MLNRMNEVRIREKDGLYRLSLEIPEKEFFLIFYSILQIT